MSISLAVSVNNQSFQIVLDEFLNARIRRGTNATAKDLLEILAHLRAEADHFFTGFGVDDRGGDVVLGL
ncbi:MAG: hypothetical protein WD534_06545, partial [Phycisphaeraceae bacterium]